MINFQPQYRQKTQTLKFIRTVKLFFYLFFFIFFYSIFILTLYYIEKCIVKWSEHNNNNNKDNISHILNHTRPKRSGTANRSTFPFCCCWPLNALSLVTPIWICERLSAKSFTVKWCSFAYLFSGNATTSTALQPFSLPSRTAFNRYCNLLAR